MEMDSFIRGTYIHVHAHAHIYIYICICIYIYIEGCAHVHINLFVFFGEADDSEDNEEAARPGRSRMREGLRVRAPKP